MKLMTGPWVAATVIVVGLAASTASAGSRGQKNAKGNGGGSHSMTGCLQKGTEGTMFMLTSVEGKGPKPWSWLRWPRASISRRTSGTR